MTVAVGLLGAVAVRGGNSGSGVVVTVGIRVGVGVWVGVRLRLWAGVGVGVWVGVGKGLGPNGGPTGDRWEVFTMTPAHRLYSDIVI